MNGNVNAGLARAVDLSRDLLVEAEQGNARAVADLDAERFRLLQLQCAKSRILDASGRQLLREITELNDRALGLLEHLQRGTERQMDTVAVGRRALNAYLTPGL